MQRGAETVGGKLFLTDQRLYFHTHALNVATGPENIELDQVASISPTWTKFLGFIPVFPNSMRVTTKDGRNFDFVVWGRTAWKAVIESQAQIRV